MRERWNRRAVMKGMSKREEGILGKEIPVHVSKAWRVRKREGVQLENGKLEKRGRRAWKEYTHKLEGKTEKMVVNTYVQYTDIKCELIKVLVLVLHLKYNKAFNANKPIVKPYILHLTAY